MENVFALIGLIHSGAHLEIIKANAARCLVHTIIIFEFHGRKLCLYNSLDFGLYLHRWQLNLSSLSIPLINHNMFIYNHSQNGQSRNLIDIMNNLSSLIITINLCVDLESMFIIDSMILAIVLLMDVDVSVIY